MQRSGIRGMHTMKSGNSATRHNFPDSIRDGVGRISIVCKAVSIRATLAAWNGANSAIDQAKKRT